MKIFLQLILVLVVVSTVFICAIKPNMHKSFFVYNSDYKIVYENTVTKTTEEIPVAEIKVTTPETKVLKVEKTVAQKTPQKTVTTKSSAVKRQTAARQNTSAKINRTAETTVKTVKTAQPAVERKNTEKTLQHTQTTVADETKPVTKEVKVTPKSVTETQQKTLTQEEIDIAWNVWRSNLQNSIMSNVKLPIMPHGIIFKFTFNVDKYGRISNVQTWCDNPSYTPYAIQYIAPVIRSHQGKSILNFPTGSKRTITQVYGAWKISDRQEFSTPQDYNDIEKVLK